MADEKLPNWDFIGRCFDVLKTDPLKIEDSAKMRMALEFNRDKFEDVGDGRHKGPRETEYRPATGGKSVSNTITISSSYDFRTFNKLETSVSVSGPGESFQGTASTSYTSTRNETGSRQKTVTYTRQSVKRYILEVKEKERKPSRELTDAVASLPSNSDEAAYKSFLKQFGTHYSTEVLFGGQLYQRIVVEEREYATFLEQGLDFAAEVKATFEIAKGSARVAGEDKRSKQFKDATKNSTEELEYTGGLPKKDFDSWSDSVKDDPAPITVILNPLYELLTTSFFPEDADIGKKQALLQKEIDSYIRSNGEDVTKALLHYGEPIVLRLGAKDPPRYVSGAPSTHYARTLSFNSLENTAAQSAHLKWALVNAKNPSDKGVVNDGDLVALKDINGDYLDAQAGSDETYDKGAGLTAASGTDPKARTTSWKLMLADDRHRKEVVDGDYIRLQSQWENEDDYLGFLQGEFNPRDTFQRVFSIGKKLSPGTVWWLSKDIGS